VNLGLTLTSVSDSAGDKICLFGFSRGAYTVRGLASMLQKVGLLPQGNKESIRAAYKLYAREDQEGLDLCRDFKASFAIDVDIQFVGVFDTVASVGIAARTLPFVSTNDSIRFFRQALALDERRVLASRLSSLRARLTPVRQAKFMPVFYKSTTDAHDATELQNQETSRPCSEDAQKQKLQKQSIIGALHPREASAHQLQASQRERYKVCPRIQRQARRH
jgi:uncharacterized protein (DUF2235 family)